MVTYRRLLPYLSFHPSGCGIHNPSPISEWSGRAKEVRSYSNYTTAPSLDIKTNEGPKSTSPARAARQQNRGPSACLLRRVCVIVATPNDATELNAITPRAIAFANKAIEYRQAGQREQAVEPALEAVILPRSFLPLARDAVLSHLAWTLNICVSC